MSKFEPFSFGSLEDLVRKGEELGTPLALSEDLSPLARPVRIGNRTAPNSMAVLPMEGCDGGPDGSPTELVLRRYRRFSGGGAGLLWHEACAVVGEGRANPRQLWIHRDNVGRFRELVELCNATAWAERGHRPVNILQLTHSGRYSRPESAPAPVIPQHDPLLDPRVGIGAEDPVVTDEYLEELVERYAEAALLAREAGYDGVDVKACHRYLVSELLASHTREGRYGGSRENRSQFLLDTVQAVRKAAGEDFIIACRFNVYDAHPFPYGFGVDQEDFMKWDEREPMELVRELVKAGVDLLSNSAGNPYYRYPQVTRPLDLPVIGGETPEEHPLESVARLFRFTRRIQEEAKEIPVVGNGYSWLRQFFPYAGAANLAEGSCSLVGLGREAFAYPQAPAHILDRGELDPRLCCIACSKCTQIMRDGGRTGCVVRDGKIYAPLYKAAREAAKAARKAALAREA